MEAPICDPGTWKLRQENHPEFNTAILDYGVFYTDTQTHKEGGIGPVPLPALK